MTTSFFQNVKKSKVLEECSWPQDEEECVTYVWSNPGLKVSKGSSSGCKSCVATVLLSKKSIFTTVDFLQPISNSVAC